MEMEKEQNKKQMVDLLEKLFLSCDKNNREFEEMVCSYFPKYHHRWTNGYNLKRRIQELVNGVKDYSERWEIEPASIKEILTAIIKFCPWKLSLEIGNQNIENICSTLFTDHGLLILFAMAHFEKDYMQRTINLFLENVSLENKVNIHAAALILAEISK